MRTIERTLSTLAIRGTDAIGARPALAFGLAMAVAALVAFALLGGDARLGS